MQIRFTYSTHIIFSWAFLCAESKGKSGGPLMERRKRVIRGATRCYRDDGLIRADFQGERATRAVAPTKKSTPMSAVQVQSRRESRFRSAQFAPGPSSLDASGAPPLGRAHPPAPRFVPSRFTASCRSGRPWSLRTLGPTTPRDASSSSLFPVDAAAQHPLISLAGLLLESSPALILLEPPPSRILSSDHLSFSRPPLGPSALSIASWWNACGIGR